ncbi:hypothetical protein D3C86_1452440 [compost metagenome]
MPGDAAEGESAEALVLTQIGGSGPVQVGLLDLAVADEVVEEGVADQSVDGRAGRKGPAGRARHAANHLGALLAQGTAGGRGVVQVEVDDCGLSDAELGEVVVDHRSAVSIQQEALQGAEAVELVRQIHVVAHRRHAAQILRLDLHQFGLVAEGADALDLFGIEREAFRQASGLQRDGVAWIDLQLLGGSAGRAGGDQAKLVLAAVDEDGSRPRRHRLEDVERPQQLGLVADLGDRAGERGHREGRRVEDVHGRHGVCPP